MSQGRWGSQWNICYSASCYHGQPELSPVQKPGSQWTHVSESSHMRDVGAGIFHQFQSVLDEAAPKDPKSLSLLDCWREGASRLWRPHNASARSQRLSSIRCMDESKGIRVGNDRASRVSHIASNCQNWDLNADVPNSRVLTLNDLALQRNKPSCDLGKPPHLSELQDQWGLFCLPYLTKALSWDDSMDMSALWWSARPSLVQLYDHSRQVGKSHSRQTFRAFLMITKRN